MGGLAESLSQPNFLGSYVNNNPGTYIGPYNRETLENMGYPTQRPTNIPSKTGSSPSFLDSLGDLGKLGNLASGIGGLASSFAAFKQLGLAEDAFKFNKEMKEKEYAMAKDAYDRNVKRATSIGDQMRAGSVG